jgi:rhodanese-related sulfurtransferase
MQTAQQMRLGGRADLAARPTTAFARQRPLVAPRVGRTAVLASAKRTDDASQNVLLPAGLVALSLTAAGQALAETVTPTGSGIPVAGGASAGGALSVDGAVNQLVDAIKAAGGYVQQGLDVAGVGAQYAKEAADKASPYVRSAAETVSPYVKTAVDTVRDVAGPALRQAQPQLQSSLSDAQRLLQQQGLDTNAVAGASRTATQQANGVFDQVRPALSSALDFVRTTDPGLLAEYAVGGLALYYLGPSLLGLVFGGLRGYAGDLSAPAALDLVSTRGNTFIIDLRSSREKESGGALDVPGGGRLIELEYAQVEDRKLRGQLRNVPRLELLVTSEEVASLKKVGKGSTLLLLDNNDGRAKAVAKQLASRGFRRAFTVTRGFKGWTENRLRVKPSSSVSRVEVLSPGALANFGTGRNTVSGRKALPSGR